MINIYDLTGSEQFKTLPYERKQYALNRYFTDFVSSDKRFLSLSDGEQKKAYSTFMKTHLGEPPMTPKEQAAYAQMVEADTITPEKAEQYNKQIELGRQSSDVIDIAPKLSLPKDYTPADTSKMDKESKKQYYRAAESLQIAKQLGNKESAEHWEGMLRYYKNKDEYDRTGVIISTAGQEAVRKQNLEFMASATRSDFPLEPTYPQQQLTKIKEKEAVEEREEQFYEKKEQKNREQAISYQDNNRRLMRLALIKSSWTPEQNAEYGKLLKEQGEIEEYFKSGGLTPRQRDAIMLGSKAAKERNLASSMADAFFSGTLQFVTSPYTVFVPSSGISDYMYYYDMGYGSEVGAIESLFRGTVSSLPMNLMMMVNPAVGVALTMSSITSSGIKEDYEAGMLDAQAIMTNILSGAVQTAIEYMSADAQKAIYTKTFRTGGMKALQDAVREDVKNVFFPTFKSFVSAFGASAVEEGMEEIYQNVADRIIRATVNDEEMPDLKEWVPELAYEFAGGFLGAALTGTAFSAIQISQSKKMQQNITKYANQGYEYAKLTQNAIDAVNAGNYDQAFNLISQAQDAAREIDNPNKHVLQGMGTVQSAIMTYDKNQIVVTEAIIDAHEIRAKDLRQELAELKKARYVNEDAALSRDARVLEIQEELVEIRDNILARQQSLVANEHVAVMKKSMDKMIEHIEANPELAEKYALQAAQAQESALLSAREISESDKAGLQAGISTEDDYRTAVDRHFTEGLADEVIEMEMKPGDFAPSRIEPYVYTDINIDESVTPKKTKEKKTDVKSEAKEDKEMAKPEPLAEDTLKTIKAEADKAIASKDKANIQKAKETLDEALKENKDQRLLDIRRSVVREIVNINEQERAVKDKEKAEVTRQAQEKAKEERKADERKSRKDQLITKGMDADIEKYRINTSQYKNKSEIADAIIERENAVKADMKAYRSKLMGMKWEQVKDAASELKVPIKGTRAELTKAIIEAKEVQLIKDISTKETTSHERGLIKDYNEGMKPKVDEAVQKISDTVQAVKDTRIDLLREMDGAKRGEYEAEISKKVEEIDSVIAELKSIQKEAGDNYIAVERIQTEINRLENVVRPLSKADVTQKVDVNLSEANEMIDTRSIKKTGAIPEAQIGDTVTVSKEGYNFEITNVLVPLNEVVVSHDVDMNTNEEYPAGLQNRDRELQADAVNKISAELNPRIMMHNDIASDGRPIGFIGKDGKVYIIAGNGRTIALKMRADGRYGDLSGYEQTLKENLKKLGFQGQDVEGKILVGIYNGREDLVKLAISLNRGEGHALGETEAARTDARKMIKMDETDDGIIRLLSEKGDILSESNNKFVNAFIDEVVPDSERSKYRAKGKILVKVEERIKNALFMYVFDDDTRAAKLMSSLQATGDSNVRSMLHGIMENIKEMALLKYLDPSLDFSSDLIDAVYEVDNLRKQGENLDLAQNQMDVFEDDKAKNQLLTSIYRIKSPKKAADYVKAYVDLSLRYAGESLDFAKVTKEQVRTEFLQKWLFGEIKDRKSAKEAYIKARELTVHAPLPELEFTLYEAMAEQLAPRMGLTVDEYFAKYFGVFTTEDPTETETEASEQSIEYQLQAEGEVRYQKSKTVPKKVVQAYRMGILNEDGTLSPVMVDTKTTKPRYEIGQWYDAEVRKSTMKVIPGFHFAETPSLSQLYKKDGTLAKGRVYYIAEYSADKSYQAEADAAGGNLENQIPTDGYYFRGKMGKGGWAISGKMRPVRILSMQEVDAINRKAGIETINGMPIEKYNKMQAKTRYQVPKYVREIMEVRRKYEGTDKWMKAPNGKPTNLTERQWIHVRTESFKSWFGDWENDPKNASKVVDENGEPRVAYHGVGHDEKIDFFDYAKRGSYTGSRSAYKGFFFAKDIHTSAEYADSIRPGNPVAIIRDTQQKLKPLINVGAEAGIPIALEYKKTIDSGGLIIDAHEPRLMDRVYDFLLNTIMAIDKEWKDIYRENERRAREGEALAKPLIPYYKYKKIVVDATKEHLNIMNKRISLINIESAFLNIEDPLIHDFKGRRFRDESYANVLDRAIKAGKDGAILRNTYDGAGMTDIYVAFTDTQMKSATENIGAYGRDTNLIRMQETIQETIKGYVEKMPNGKYRVGFLDADPTTGLHEQGHIGKDMLYVMAKIDPAWERYVKIAEEFCGVGEDGVWTTNAEEKFANGYVKYITEGKAPTPQLKTVFEKIKDLISKVVSKIAEIMNIELTDDIREVYGALLGAEITTKEYTRKAKVDAFITKVDAADFASKGVDVLTKRLDSEFGPQSRFITDRKLSRGKVHMNIIDIDMGNTIVNIAQVDDGYIVNGFHAATNGDAMDIVNKTINDYAPGDIDMGKKDSTRFQMPSYTREQMEVRRKYEGTDKWMKAPNGKPTNLTERQWIHVRTESFKSWFGDWENDPKNASKVVDENGEPRVVYHGSRSIEGFTEFHKVSFFTDDIKTAEIFKTENAYTLQVNSEVIGMGEQEVKDITGFIEPYLDIDWHVGWDIIDAYQDNPEFLDPLKKYLLKNYSIKEDIETLRIDEVEKDVMDVFLNIRNPKVKDYGGRTWGETDTVIEHDFDMSKDGFIAKNIVEGGLGVSEDFPVSTTYVAFDPNQIKSATGNVGSFDGGTADIRYQKSDAYEKKQKFIQEQMDVRKKYEGTDKWMKAPNGKPTNLTERQWIHVRTESFKSWFGDWENDPKNASKVVDENGEPLAVWHGTKEGGFTIFAKEKLGSNTKSPSAYKGHFFAGKESTSASIGYIGEVALETSSALSNTIEMVENAAFYATEMLSEIEARGYDDGYSEELDLDIRNAAYEYSGDHKGYEEAIVSLVENIESDLNYNIDNLLEHGYSQHDIDEAIKSLKQVSDIVAGIRTDFSFGESGESMYNVFLNVRNPIEHDYFGRNRGRSFNEIIDEGSNAGNDGAIFKRVRDGGDIDNIYVAFDNTQIKSATDNVGSYDPSTPDIRYQKSDAYESRQKFIQEQNETNAKIIREELDTAPSAEKAKEAVVNAIKRALMINYEGAEVMDVIKRREIARAIKKQQKLGNTEAVEKLKAALELMRKRDQRFRDILREETGFRNINNITLEQALKMLDRVDPVLYDRFVNESTRKVLVNSINLLESMGKKGFVYDKNTLDLFFDYFTSEHVDTVKRSGLSTLFLMPQRYLVETFGKAGQKLVELAYLGTTKRSDYEHQYHPSLQRIYDLQMTNKNGRGMAYRGEEIDAIGRTIFEVDGNSRIAPENKLSTIQSVLEKWAEDNGTVINKGDIEDMYNAKQDIIAIFEGIIVEFNNSEIAKLHGIQIGLIEEYGNPRIYEQEGSAKPAKDKILHVPANVKERTEVDYNAKAKHNTNLYEVYLSYATSMAKYMAFYELATYMEGNEALIPGSGEGENVTIVPAQFFRDISSIQRVAAKGALKENGYVYKYIKNVIGSNETPTSATRMFDALKTITFASTLVPSIPMTILNFHQRTLIDTQVGAEIAWQVRKDIKFFSGRGRFDSEAFPTLSRIMDMYRGADTSLIAETASAAQKSATEGGRSWFAKMYYKGAELSAKMLEASPFSKAELGNRAYAHLAGIYQIVTQTAEYKQARKEGMKFRQAVEHVLANHDNIRQAAIRNGGVVNAEINADVNPAFAPQIFWKDTSIHKYLMFVRYGITLAQLEMRKFAAPFLSMKSRQSQQIYDMLRSGNIQAADHAQYIQAAQIMLKMTDERARSKMLTEGKIDSKKMSDKRLSIQEVESFHNMIQQILDESVEVAKEKHSGVIKSTKTETLEAAQMMSFTIRELMLRTILTFVISMLPTWRKDEKEIDIIAMLSELNTYIGLFQTPQLITDFRLGGAMVPRLEYFHKDKQIIKGLTDWALRSLPGIGILNNFVKGITGKAISDDIVDAAYPSKQQKGKRNK